MTAPTLPPRAPEQDPGDPGGSAATRSPSPLHRLGAGLRGGVAHARSLGVGRVLRAPVVAGLLGALWAAAIGLAVSAACLVLVWVATPSSGLTLLESFRVAGLLWIVAHGTPVLIGPVTYSLLPWGLALVPVLLLAYAGGWAVRWSRTTTLRGLVAILASGVLVYCAVAFAVSQVTARDQVQTGAMLAVAHACVLSALAFGFGAGRACPDVLDAAVPAWLRLGVRSGSVAAVAILGFGAIAGAAALIVRVDDMVTMTQSLHAGVWGGLALLVLGLAYLPVAIVWASSYLLGAGFVIGPAVVVSPFIPATSPTQLPPFPLLAGIPQSATPLAWALPITGVVAGVLAGLVISRRARAQARVMRLLYAAEAAVVSGLLLALAALMADGALGDVRLTHLGPSALTVGVLTFALVLLGAVPSAMIGGAPRKPRLTVAEPEAEPVPFEEPAAAPEPVVAEAPLEPEPVQHDATTLVVARPEENDDV